jgi:hypothetical protein
MKSALCEESRHRVVRGRFAIDLFNQHAARRLITAACALE